MSTPQLFIGLIAGSILLSDAGEVNAQAYPTKPLRFITGSAGSGADFASRIFAQGLTAAWGQPVVVENRGAGSVVVAPMVASAPPDGYTLLFFGSSIWMTPLMRERAPYDPLKDLAPVTLAVSSPSVLVVHPSVAVNSVKELIALAKAKPGALNYASTGPGSVSHLASELFKAMANVDVMRINYKGTAPATTDLLAGAVQLAFTTTTAAGPHIKSGKLKALAVASVKPSALMPGMPTVAASGLPGFEASSTQGMFAPGKTPPALVSRINRELVRILATADAKERLFNTGVEVVGSTPEQFVATIKSDWARLGKVIRDAGIREE